jgi:hypothetical protein
VIDGVDWAGILVGGQLDSPWRGGPVDWGLATQPGLKASASKRRPPIVAGAVPLQCGPGRLPGAFNIAPATSPSAGKADIMRRKRRRDPDREQVDTRLVSAAEIVGSPRFAIGVSDLRTGAAPRFDAMDDWDYERGRLWAVLAPRTMDPKSSMAVRLYEAASRRRWIT